MTSDRVAQGVAMGSVEAARRRLREVVRHGEKLGLTRSDLVSLPAARRLTSSGSRSRWKSVLTTVAVLLALTVLLTKCYVSTASASPAHDPWWQQQQQRLVSTVGSF